MAPTKTRPLLWLLPALAAAQSSCHKNKKGVRCNNRTGRDRRCSALTTDAALLHMAHWSTADVFLAGHSSFSSIPALLNPNCVMAPMYTPNSAKRACVARVARARAAELSRA